MKLLVALALLLWEPLNFAAQALAVLPTIAHREALAALELIVHGLIAALSAAAGLALWNSAPDSKRLAALAIVLSSLRVVQSLYWSVLPSNTIPGDEPIHAGVAVVVASIAIVIVARSSEGPG